jgi:hypothetical protein
MEFVRARIAEDEALALHAGGAWWRTAWGNPPNMTRHPEPVEVFVDSEATLITYSAANPAYAAHIVQHDPARVLAECESKRRIMAEVTGWAATFSYEEWGDDGRAALSMTDQFMDRILYGLALPYAEHPDFREEWRP